MTTFPGADVPPRAAATLVPLRRRDADFEVLLTIRPKTMRFMGGAAVFPGGSVSEADLDERWEEVSAISAEEAAEALDSDDPRAALGAYVCALRESFEEVGLLLADGPVERLSRDDADDAARLLERCIEEGITLRTDLLTPGGRWVTPLGSPVRFDARFFLAEVPEGWEPDPDPTEVDGVMWMVPAAAVVELAAGRLLMAPPTVEMIQRLEAHSTIEETVAALARKGVGTAGVLSVRLSPLVYVVLAPNPGLMTGPGTNTYVVGTGPTFVIDPAVDDEGYLDVVCEAAGEVAAILVTHRHPDHVGGVEALAQRTGAPVRAWSSDPAGGVSADPLSDGEILTAGGVRLKTLYAPGHASDHVCFYIEEVASLFAGDNVLGEGTAVIAPPDGNMQDYLDTLHRLRTFHTERIYPGHFRPLDGGDEVIDGYIEHRMKRERAIATAVRAGDKTVEEIVEQVYADTPPALHPIARYSVLAHLEMLERKGQVEHSNDRWNPKRLH